MLPQRKGGLYGCNRETEGTGGWKQQYCIFWRRRCIYGEWDTGFSEHGWTVSSAVRLSTRTDF